MTKKFTQLLLAERERIYQLHRKGFSYAKIAVALGRARSTIYGELKRNRYRDKHYVPKLADNTAQHRKKRPVNPRSLSPNRV